MPRLEHLRKSLQHMTEEELREKIRSIREDRKITKTAPKVRKAKAHAKDKVKSKLEDLLAAMSPEEQAEFIKSLEG